MSGQKPREIAAQILQRRQAGAADFVENVLEKALAGAQLSPADRGLCQELTYGVVRWQAALDELIARKTGGRVQKPPLQILLRLGLYQIFWLDRIPAHAAVNETVEQARSNGFGAQAGFVNAILRGYLREFDATKHWLSELKSAQPHLGFSHPEWLVTRWRKRWGADKAAHLMDWNNTPPKIFARINTLRLGAAGEAQPDRPRAMERKLEHAGDVLTQWRDENVEYDFVRREWLEENLAFELKAHPPLTTLPSFQQGLFYVQDPGTLLAVRELNPQPGETILDLCAAPGGKTTYIAQLMQNRGRVVAHDAAERLKLVAENCRRLGVTIVECRPPVADGRASQSDIDDMAFDRVLIDAPCSNTGVMRRRVDLRWRIQPEEIERLRAAQLDLLQRAAPLLRPGGTLVYSTCSLEPEENREVVAQFLRSRPRFKLERDRELLPFADGVDGAYVATLTRK